MNRLQPCGACGCPILYHRASSAPGIPPGAMVCDSCSRTQGREVVCASEPT